MTVGEEAVVAALKCRVDQVLAAEPKSAVRVSKRKSKDSKLLSKEKRLRHAAKVASAANLIVCRDICAVEGVDVLEGREQLRHV